MKKTNSDTHYLMHGYDPLECGCTFTFTCEKHKIENIILYVKNLKGFFEEHEEDLGSLYKAIGDKLAESASKELF